jgi:hypothetical protein
VPDDIRPSRPEGIDLGHALRALPAEAPERSTWPAIAARLPRRAPRRLPWLAAAAAVLALALALPLLHTPTPSGPAAPDADTLALDALYDESARLEALLLVAADDSVASASVATLGAALHDRLAAIDDALADPALDASLRLPLWRQRVAVLRELAGLETSRQWLASQGERYDGALVVAY